MVRKVVCYTECSADLQGILFLMYKGTNTFLPINKIFRTDCNRKVKREILKYIFSVISLLTAIVL